VTRPMRQQVGKKGEAASSLCGVPDTRGAVVQIDAGDYRKEAM
jgi:hypothetical protein